MGKINWYPGHMKKTREQIQERLRRIDVVMELRDARIPRSSRNPVLDEIIGDKPRLILLNKADLADPAVTRRWIAWFRSQGIPCRELSILKRKGLKGLGEACGKLKMGSDAQKSTQRTRQRTRKIVKTMVVGIPNVGKSALLNALIGKKKAAVGDKAGVTRHLQRAAREDGLMIFDTPGVLWPNLDDQEGALHLAILGAIRDTILDEREIALGAAGILSRSYPEAFSARYGDLPGGISCEDTAAMIQAVGRKRGALLGGGAIDFDLSSRYLIQDVRAGRLGPLSWEMPPDGRDEGETAIPSEGRV